MGDRLKSGRGMRHLGRHDDLAGEAADRPGASSRRWPGARPAVGIPGTVVLLAVVSGSLLLTWWVGYGWAETYGSSPGIFWVTSIAGLVLWLIAVNLMLLIRWLSRWNWPRPVPTSLLLLAAVMVVAVAGPIKGDADRWSGLAAAGDTYGNGGAALQVELDGATGRVAAGSSALHNDKAWLELKEQP